MLICDGCNLAYHTYCLKMKAVPEIYWYCPACSIGIRENGVQDETKDLEFLELVKRETEARAIIKGAICGLARACTYSRDVNTWSTSLRDSVSCGWSTSTIS